MWGKKTNMYDLNPLLWPMLCMFLGQFNIGILINFLASEKRQQLGCRGENVPLVTL